MKRALLNNESKRMWREETKDKAKSFQIHNSKFYNFTHISTSNTASNTTANMYTYEGHTESHEQFFLHANWEQQTKDSAVVDGTSCCVILECLVTSIPCIT